MRVQFPLSLWPKSGISVVLLPLQSGISVFFIWFLSGISVFLRTIDSIKDNYPKYVISMIPLVRRNDRSGITHLGLREFLKNGF